MVKQGAGKEWRRDTRLTTKGRDPEANHGIVNPPVYHASTVTFPTVAALEEAAKDRLSGTYYGRFGTPTTFAFEEAVADLEGTDKCIALPSGMAAISLVLLTHLKPGDHLLMVDSAYFPTRKFCDSRLKPIGVETTYYDPLIGAGIAELIRPNTRLVFTESPGSLTFEVQDLPAIAEAAHAKGALVALDNTWSAGYFLRPFDLGVDISIQAGTKYLVGHSDAMMGTVATREELYADLKWTAVDYGFSAAPDDCYLALRGIRTLSARMAKHQETALNLAHWLKEQPQVAAVLHPALPECPGHEVWKRDFTGSSGLFSMVLKPIDKAARDEFLDNLQLFAMGYSWGGFESLAIPSDPKSFRTAAPWTVEGPLIRLQCGLEDWQDLRDDLAAGLAGL
ncbi:MAG: cystathionine beta-lyase [Magnetovibrionaceae bacterium]